MVDFDLMLGPFNLGPQGKGNLWPNGKSPTNCVSCLYSLAVSQFPDLQTLYSCTPGYGLAGTDLENGLGEFISPHSTQSGLVQETYDLTGRTFVCKA